MKGTEFLDLDHLHTREDFARLLFGLLKPLESRYNAFCTGIDTARVYAHYDVCSGSSGNAGSEGFSSEKSGGENHEI